MVNLRNANCAQLLAMRNIAYILKESKGASMTDVKENKLLSKQELDSIGYALVTLSESDNINWKTVARQLLGHIQSSPHPLPVDLRKRFEELKTWIKDDRKKLENTYGENHMLTKAYMRCLMLIDDFAKELESLQQPQVSMNEIGFLEDLLEKMGISCDVLSIRKMIMSRYKELIEMTKLQQPQLPTEWKTGETNLDGDFLCYIERKEECGNIWKYFDVVKNSFNTWTLKDGEKVIAWTYLPLPPKFQGGGE
jgi:hypothetical protein